MAILNANVVTRALSRVALARLVAAGALLTSTGCYEPVSDACELYVECWDAFAAQTGEGDPNVIAAFRLDGTCWNSPTTADECTEICQYDLACLMNEFAERDLDPPAQCSAAVIVDDNDAPITGHCGR